MKTAKTALMCSLEVLSIVPMVYSSVAQAAPYGMVYTHQYRQQLAEHFTTDVTKPKTKLLYHGGPVIAAAKIYAVMWGSECGLCHAIRNWRNARGDARQHLF